VSDSLETSVAFTLPRGRKPCTWPFYSVYGRSRAAVTLSVGQVSPSRQSRRASTVQVRRYARQFRQAPWSARRSNQYVIAPREVAYNRSNHPSGQGSEESPRASWSRWRGPEGPVADTRTPASARLTLIKNVDVSHRFQTSYLGNLFSASAMSLSIGAP
jgi:hypothetical protein